jgi:hypothetical protein
MRTRLRSKQPGHEASLRNIQLYRLRFIFLARPLAVCFLLAFRHSGKHRKNCGNLIRGCSHQALVAGLALCGGL